LRKGYKRKSMPEAVLEMINVSKKFKKGEKHHSLRDFIPALVSRLFRRNDIESLSQNEFWVLRDISFKVMRGEAFGIIGVNGAGKSTILKHISGIMKPTKGEMNVHGRLSALIEVGAGFHPDLTGRENIFLNGTILGMTRDEIRARFDEIVEFSGLGEFIDTPVKRYSSGMYARLGFSVAAHVNPDILLVDEVLSVGDWAFQRKCMEKMGSVIKGGATVIFVSHNLRAVASLCQRCMLLDHGNVLNIGPTEKVIQEYINLNSGNERNIIEKDAFISGVKILGGGSEKHLFEPGQKATVDITVSCRDNFEKLSVALYLSDENYYQIFNTSTERLGLESFSLKKGEEKKIHFDLTMHLGRGTFLLGVILQRYDINRIYDHMFPAATVFVETSKDVRGGANLYPEVKIIKGSRYTDL
jgi:lipopolysaccharide transport system ATP-binding protein